MPDLRKGQYKRLGRIAETNPERALAVAERMEKRASRAERGKEFVDNKPAREKIIKNYEQKVANSAAGRDYPLSPTPEPVNKKSWNEKSPRRAEDPKDRVFMGARKVIN